MPEPTKDYISQHQNDQGKWLKPAKTVTPTLESGIDVGQGIKVGPGKLDKNNKRRALNKCRAGKIWKIKS